jgi:predicted RNA-binding protein with PUA domain
MIRGESLHQHSSEGDLAYLANLCHNCGSCFDACQYAPPHEWGLNFPRALDVIRRVKDTYGVPVAAYNVSTT